MNGIYEKQFWFVWNQYGRAPSHKHEDFLNAKKEAERLAIANPGQTFIILESVAECVKNEVQWTSHDPNVPF